MSTTRHTTIAAISIGLLLDAVHLEARAFAVPDLDEILRLAKNGFAFPAQPSSRVVLTYLPKSCSTMPSFGPEEPAERDLRSPTSDEHHEDRHRRRLDGLRRDSERGDAGHGAGAADEQIAPPLPVRCGFSTSSVPRGASRASLRVSPLERR
ncbi:MAG: hypothetical protein R3B70_41740 [Polyangiaceae bacterium]